MTNDDTLGCLACILIFIILFFAITSCIYTITSISSYWEYVNMTNLMIDFESDNFKTNRKDRWGTAYKIIYTPKMIWSAGPDKMFYTADDIFVPKDETVKEEVK